MNLVEDLFWNILFHFPLTEDYICQDFYPYFKDDEYIGGFGRYSNFKEYLEFGYLPYKLRRLKIRLRDELGWFIVTKAQRKVLMWFNCYSSSKLLDDKGNEIIVENKYSKPMKKFVLNVMFGHYTLKQYFWNDSINNWDNKQILFKGFNFKELMKVYKHAYNI